MEHYPRQPAESGISVSGAGWFTSVGAANGGYFLPPLSAADLADLCQIRDHFGCREGSHLVNRRRAAGKGGGKGGGGTYLALGRRKRRKRKERQRSEKRGGRINMRMGRK